MLKYAKWHGENTSEKWERVPDGGPVVGCSLCEVIRETQIRGKGPWSHLGKGLYRWELAECF